MRGASGCAVSLGVRRAASAVVRPAYAGRAAKQAAQPGSAVQRVFKPWLTRERQALKGEVTTSSLSGEGSTQVLKRSTSGNSSCKL